MEMQPWYFANIPTLRNLLTKVVHHEENPQVMKHAIRLVAYASESDVPAEFDSLLARLDAERFEKSLYKTGEWFGFQLIHATDSPGDLSKSTIEASFYERLCGTWQSDDAFRSFASGALDGARNKPLLRTEDSEQFYDSWLVVANLVVRHWRFSNSNEDAKDFPVNGIWGVLENEPLATLRSVLFNGFAESFLRLIEHASLGVFSNVHHLIGDMVDGRWAASQAQQAKMHVCRDTHENLMRLCRASVERVRDWHKQGKTTDGLGWGGTLNGIESAKLIRTCRAASPDPRQFAASAIGWCDVLAGSGQQGLAAELRLEMRCF